jgi:hypothetical protein
MSNLPSTSIRRSPIAQLVESSKETLKGLQYRGELVKVGVKGADLSAWAQKYQLEIPETFYDVLAVGVHGLLARVGAQEIVLECAEDDALLLTMEQALRASGNVYRIEQQSVTFELRGAQALPVLAQTCGVNLHREPPARIIYTRIAGVACGVIPMEESSERAYRIWVDYTLAPYLWETFVEIIREL